MYWVTGSSQNKNLRKLNESKLARRGVTGFFIGLMLFNTAQLSVFALLQERAYAAERNIPALESERLETAELEPGVVGAPKGDQQDVTKDPAVYTHDVFEEKELVNERDRFTEVLQNEDGSKTLNNYLTPRNYQKDGKWKVIDTTLVEDTNAADGGWFASAVGWVESVFRDEETFKVKENDWQAKFAPSDDEVGMVRVQSLRPIRRGSPPRNPRLYHQHCHKCE